MMGPAKAFEIAGGSIAGSAHVAAGRNNQDAFAWAKTASGIVAVVCDGCSGAPHSHVGACIIARLIVQSVARWLNAGNVERSERSERSGYPLQMTSLLDCVRDDVVAHVRVLASAMSAETKHDRASGAMSAFRRTVADHFLCTVVGVVIDAHFATTFSLGDGLVVINGQQERLGPFANNAPPYLGYELLGIARRGFEILRSVPVADIESLMIGTDGANDLGTKAEHFWTDDRVFKNPDMVRRRLTILNREMRLADDTTLVVLRRTKEAA
jgi:hypothetical protein